MSDILCENCAYYTYDDEYEEYICDINIDEDEMMRIVSSKYKKCPYYKDGDEYKVVKRQN